MKLRNITLRLTQNGEMVEHVFTEGTDFGETRSVCTFNGDRFTLDLEASSEVILDSVKAEFDYDFDPKDRLFVNGYQSWTDSREHTVDGRLHGIYRLPGFVVKKYSFNRYGDYDFVEYGRKKGQLHGFSYAYVRRGEEFTLFASLAEQSGFTVIRFDTRAGTLTFEKDCKDLCVSGKYSVFDLAVIRGKENEVFDRYFSLLDIPAAEGKRITGYTSWYNLYENITEATVISDLEGFTASGERPDVFQIDDGYESAVGDWLEVDRAKFPSGMKYIADRIRECGMIPGIWLAPFAAEKKSALVKDHPDWILRDKNGGMVDGGCNWSGFYAIDIYNDEFREYIRRVFDTVRLEWGYELLKLDFLYAACIVPRRDKNRAEVMYDGMKFLREICGDAMILGCGVPLAPAYGNVDYCRIGCDVSLSWDDVFYMRPMHRERASTKNTVLNTVFRRQLDGRAFRCDPDVFLLRDDNIKLSAKEKRTLAEVNSLFGGVLFTSDNVSSYSEDAKKMYESMLEIDYSMFRSAETDEHGATVTYVRNGEEHILHIPF